MVFCKPFGEAFSFGWEHRFSASMFLMADLNFSNPNLCLSCVNADGSIYACLSAQAMV